MKSAKAIRIALLASPLLIVPAHAGTFDGGVPAGWTCTGNCGTSGANGVVPLSPAGGTAYGWVSSYNSTAKVALPGVSPAGEIANGSTLRSVAFTSTAGAELDFRFNYVTTDGASFADYAWVRLLDGSNNQVAILFTARTTSGGNAVPGFDMPAPVAELTPFPVAITAGATEWAPLGQYSDSCYDFGCGSTGWVRSQYTIASSGTYRLEFGVTNWNDAAFDSGLAFDAIALGGEPLPIPEPGQAGMMLAGLALLGTLRRRR